MLRQSLEITSIIISMMMIGAVQAQNSTILYENTGFLDPGSDVQLTDKIVMNENVSVLVNVTGYICDSQGNNCLKENAKGLQAALSLYCGNPSDIGGYLVSDYVGGDQVLLITNNTPSVVDANVTEQQIGCWVHAEDYNAGQVKYEFVATQLASLPTLNETQQENLAVTFQNCCVNEEDCLYWKQLNKGAQSNGTNEVFTDFCKVGGNFCSEDGNLTTLYMSKFGLQCNINDIQFKDLTSLKRIVLSENNLTGNVYVFMEQSLSSVNALSDIQINSNSVEGQMYISVLNSTVNATVGGGVCGLIGKGLQGIAFSQTNVSGAVPSCIFGSESVLQRMDAAFTDLSGELPSSLSNASRIQMLRISHANLNATTIPSLPGSLAELNVTMNAINASVPDLPESMVILDISNNNFNGSVPDTFYDHPVLRAADMSANNIMGLPQGWESTDSNPSQNPPLQYLYLSYNPLQASFPAGLATYPQLQLLVLTMSNLTGGLPDIGKAGFPQLLTLFVNSNDINGTIPDSWQTANIFTQRSSIDQERFGDFSNNLMGGELPSWLGEPIVNARYNFSGNNFSNGCDQAFNQLNACDGSVAPSQDQVLSPEPAAETSAPSPSAEPAEAPAAEKSTDDSGGGGLSNGAIAGIVIVILILAGVGAFFGYKKWKSSRTEGSFQRFDDASIQMTNPSQNPYNPQLEP